MIPDVKSFKKSFKKYKHDVINQLNKYYMTDTGERSSKLKKMINDVLELKSQRDIVFYLISELWTEEYQTTIINKTFLHKARKYKFIEAYYNKLFNDTDKAFEMRGFKGRETYGYIFKDGMKYLSKIYELSLIRDNKTK